MSEIKHEPVPVGTETPKPGDNPLALPVSLTLFGHESVATEITVIARSLRWRMVRTGRVVAIFAVVTPIVGIVPPHAPWIVGALTAAAIFSRRKWTERFSVADFNAPCPRCGSGLTLRQGARFHPPHSVPCDDCGHEPILTAKLPT